MVQATTQKLPERTPPGIRPRSTPMTMCPMAMCDGMMKRRPSTLLLMVPGAALIIIGVLIFLEPLVLVWLMAAAFTLLGVMLLVMANFIRRLRAQPQNR